VESKSGNTGKNEFIRAYSTYFSAIFGAVYHRTGNYQESEDICQEIFLGLFDRIDGVNNVRAWLYSAMRNKIVDYYREKGRSPDEITLMVEESSVAYVNGFRDTRIIIQQVLDDPGTFSDERERVLFDLVAVEGFSVAEAAEHTGITHRQARYGFEKAAVGIADALKKRGISSIEELL
jgi:RNA polymerase sigma factor (sigma-70 family)